MGTIREVNEKFEKLAKENETTDKTKEQRDADFWKLAVEVWNENMAGEITLVDGRKIEIPTFEM